MKKLIDLCWCHMLATLGVHAYADVTTIDQLNDRLLELNELSESIIARADAENRDLTEDETKELNGYMDEFKQVEANIERRERINAQATKLAARHGRQTDPAAGEGEGDGTQSHQNAPKPKQGLLAPHTPGPKGKWGWRDFGEFATHVRAAAMPNGRGTDPRLLQNAPTTYSSEGVGADGGFLVPPDFRTSIMETVMAEASLLGRTDQMESSSNSIVLPKDETTAWQSTGGVQAYWEGENQQLTQSKLALKQNQLRLNKLTALVPVTEELLDDAAAVDSYLRKKVPEKFDYKINDAIINGNGAGMPLGMMNSGAMISVTKESGQSADTLVHENIENMWARMYAPSRASAVWLINQDIEPQLGTMGFSTSATAVPIYMPANNLSGAPFDTLKGRPIIPVESCQTLGDSGDIILADLSQYLSVIKVQGIRTDVSMHLWFDYDTLAYRFIFRVAGQPWRDTTISPANGTVTRSSFIKLDARA